MANALPLSYGKLSLAGRNRTCVIGSCRSNSRLHHAADQNSNSSTSFTWFFSAHTSTLFSATPHLAPTGMPRKIGRNRRSRFYPGFEPGALRLHRRSSRELHHPERRKNTSPQRMPLDRNDLSGVTYEGRAKSRLRDRFAASSIDHDLVFLVPSSAFYAQRLP
jgi:hypothetical protein